MDRQIVARQGFGNGGGLNNGGNGFGNPFNQQASTSGVCTNVFGIGIPCSTSTPPTQQQTSSPQRTSSTLATSTSARIPEGTGAIITTTYVAFGMRVVDSGRLFAVSPTVDAQGNTIVAEQLVFANGNVLSAGLSTIPPSTTPTLSSPITATETSDASNSDITTPSTTSIAPTGATSAAGASSNNGVAQQSHSQNHGISAGAIAAAVVVPVVVLALLALLAFFLIRRKRRNNAATAPYEGNSGRSSRTLFGALPIFGKKRTGNVQEYYNHPSSDASTVHEASEKEMMSQRAPAAAATSTAGGAALGSAAMRYAGHQQSNNTTPDQSNYTSGYTTPGSDPFGDSHTAFSGFSGNHATGSGGSTAAPSGAATSTVLSPTISRGQSHAPTGRPSLDERDESDGEEEYQDAQVSNAAVGVTQRASVINLITTGTSPKQHGRLGSGSSGGSAIDAQRQASS